MIYRQMVGFAVTFLVLLMVAGAGIVLVLDTFGSELQIAAGVTLALVVLAVGAVAGLGSKNREWIANPYW